MKKRVLALTTALAAVALASCGKQETEVGLTTVMPESEASADLVRGLINPIKTYNSASIKSVDHCYKVDGKAYTSVGSSYYKVYDTTTKSTTLYNKISKETVCDLNDGTNLTYTVTSNYINGVTVKKTMTTGGRLVESYTIYSYDGVAIFSDVDSSYISYTGCDYYTFSDERHNVRVYYGNDDNKTLLKYVDYNYATGETKWLDSDPRKDLLIEDYNKSTDFGVDGYYLVDSVNSGKKLSFFDASGAKIRDILIPSNATAYFANDGYIYYQTETIVEDGLDDYDVYSIDSDNGERIQCKLKNVKVDIKTGEVSEFAADYIICGDLLENESSEYAAIKYYAINDKKIEIETPHAGVVDKEGKLVYSLDSLPYFDMRLSVTLSDFSLLDGGAYYYDAPYGSSDAIYSSSFDLVATDVSQVTAGKLYSATSNGKTYYIDGSGKVVKNATFVDYSTALELDGYYYENVNGSLKKLDIDYEKGNFGGSGNILYTYTDLTENMTAAEKAVYSGATYKVDLHYLNTDVSWTVYTNSDPTSLHISTNFATIITYDMTVYLNSDKSNIIDYTLLK